MVKMNNITDLRIKVIAEDSSTFQPAERCMYLSRVTEWYFLFFFQIPGWTAAGELRTQVRQEHVQLLIQLLFIDLTLLWDQWSWLTLLSAESYHQLLWWSLFVSSVLGCQLQTQPLNFWLQSSPLFHKHLLLSHVGRQRRWRVKTEWSQNSSWKIEISEQGWGGVVDC